MSKAITPLIVGNWKMNGLIEQLGEIDNLDYELSKVEKITCSVVICPPATLLMKAALSKRHSKIAFGGQDCHSEEKGAHTGDISAKMLFDAGAQFVIVGHSERRVDHNESNEIVTQKAKAALLSGLTPIICVGESEDERKQGRALEVVLEQLTSSTPDDIGNGIVIAYEPVWAIGTGLIPTLDDIDEMHNMIRAELIKQHGKKGAKIPILYGGSMKPSNAKEILILENVNGGLVGGASLKASDFFQIISACS